MSTQIEIDTVCLREDIKSLQETLAQLERQIGRTTDTLTELDAMWDGPANQAFLESYRKNRVIFDDFCKELKALAGCMEYAARQYEACEDDVYETVSAIKV